MSVLATLTLAQDGEGGDPSGGAGSGSEDDESGSDGTEGDDPESDSETDDESFADVPCIVPPTPWGCVIRSGECDPGVTEPDKRPHILWSDQHTVSIFNQFVEILGLESLVDMMGSTPEKACGTPDEHIRCGENRIIHAVIQNVASASPTPRMVEAALELAKRGARDAAMGKACEQPEDPSAPAREDCSKVKGREGEQYRDTWHSAFAVNLFDGELATRFSAAWDEYAANERAQGRDDPGMSPIRDAGAGYYICAAAQVTWECEAKDSSSEDPPPEPEPKPKPEPGDPPDGDVPEPPPPRRFGSETPPDPPPPLEPPPTAGCKKRDKDGKEVPDTGEKGNPDTGEADKPAKCCYPSPKGKPTHCVNYGCWGKHQACVPTADGTDCECLGVEHVGTRRFPEWTEEENKNPDDPGDPPKWKDPKWVEDLEKEGKAGGGTLPGGGANGGREAGDDDPLGGDDERSEMRSVTSQGALASVEDEWRPSGGAVQTGMGLTSAGVATLAKRAVAGGPDSSSAHPPAAVIAATPSATAPGAAQPASSMPPRNDPAITHRLAW